MVYAAVVREDVCLRKNLLRGGQSVHEQNVILPPGACAILKDLQEVTVCPFL
jgi:hypothetical protein